MYKLSEAVSPGHPDKICDIISGYILDRYIERDPNIRYAVEVMIKGDIIHLAGEVTSTVLFSHGEYANFVRDALREIGYTYEYYQNWHGKVIDPEMIEVQVDITAQSPEIAQGVDNDGYGDQGIFFGYADVDGDDYMMPKSHSLAKNLCHMLYVQARDYGIGGIDIKTEIILDEGDRIEKIIAAVPCRSDEEYKQIKESILDWYNIVDVDLPFYPEIILNGTGNYMIHGPIADSGVTGRKLAVDFYGGECNIGGGTASSKDGSKSDVTLNLYARKMAKNRAASEGRSIKVSLGCCIGKSEVNYLIETPCGDVLETGVLDLKPSKLIKELELDKPIYASMQYFGLFGEFQQDKKWEKVDEQVN